mmetsp:Transcript_47658/g.119186  ORF Transcript_47658/g.119186 Transcript_47658/m.119186 type:complete len:395 (-) Transcript_47658:205-1389(-)
MCREHSSLRQVACNQTVSRDAQKTYKPKFDMDKYTRPQTGAPKSHDAYVYTSHESANQSVGLVLGVCLALGPLPLAAIVGDVLGTLLLSFLLALLHGLLAVSPLLAALLLLFLLGLLALLQATRVSPHLFALGLLHGPLHRQLGLATLPLLHVRDDLQRLTLLTNLFEVCLDLSLLAARGIWLQQCVVALCHGLLEHKIAVLNVLFDGSSSSSSSRSLAHLALLLLVGVHLIKRLLGLLLPPVAALAASLGLVRLPVGPLLAQYGMQPLPELLTRHRTATTSSVQHGCHPTTITITTLIPLPLLANQSITVLVLLVVVELKPAPLQRQLIPLAVGGALHLFLSLLGPGDLFEVLLALTLVGLDAQADLLGGGQQLRGVIALSFECVAVVLVCLL